MRRVLLGAAGVGAWLFLRGRRRDRSRVIVGWEDGSELELPAGPARASLVAVARSVAR